MKWIKVEDKKPEAGEKILVYNGYIVQALFFYNHALENNFYFLEDTGVQLPVFGVTHWANMPEIPNKTNE